MSVQRLNTCHRQLQSPAGFHSVLKMTSWEGLSCNSASSALGSKISFSLVPCRLKGTCNKCFMKQLKLFHFSGQHDCRQNFKCVLNVLSVFFLLKEHRLQKGTQKEKQTHTACTLYVLLLSNSGENISIYRSSTARNRAADARLRSSSHLGISSATLTTNWHLSNLS